MSSIDIKKPFVDTDIDSEILNHGKNFFPLEKRTTCLFEDKGGSATLTKGDAEKLAWKFEERGNEKVRYASIWFEVDVIPMTDNPTCHSTSQLRH